MRGADPAHSPWLMPAGRHEALPLPEEQVPLPHCQPRQAVDPRGRAGAQRGQCCMAVAGALCACRWPMMGMQERVGHQGSSVSALMASEKTIERSRGSLHPPAWHGSGMRREEEEIAIVLVLGSVTVIQLSSLERKNPVFCEPLRTLLSEALSLTLPSTSPPVLPCLTAGSPGLRQGRQRRPRYRRYQVRHLQGAGQGQAAQPARGCQGQVRVQAGREEDQGGRRRRRAHRLIAPLHPLV
jgi:hypothetical protein